MATATIDSILSLSDDKIGDAIAELRQTKMLSSLIKEINSLLIDGDEAARDLARRALDRLGFPETV